MTMSATAALMKDTRLAREAKQTEVDKSRGDLNAILSSANHKRRVFTEALDAYRMRSRVGFGIAAAGSAGTVAAMAVVALSPANAPLAWVAACVLGVSSILGFGFGFYEETSEARESLYRDVIACGVLIGQMRALSAGDEHASAFGQIKLDGCVDEFSNVCNRHLDISPNKFNNTRRHDRYKVDRVAFMTVHKGAKPQAIRIFDISRSGLAVETGIKLKVGSVVMIGRTEARVVRTIKDGLGLTFSKVFPPNAFTTDMAL